MKNIQMGMKKNPAPSRIATTLPALTIFGVRFG
jgi:hypothetical protein